MVLSNFLLHFQLGLGRRGLPRDKNFVAIFINHLLEIVLAEHRNNIGRVDQRRVFFSYFLHHIFIQYSDLKIPYFFSE